MSLVHVYPIKEKKRHSADIGGCWCEPYVLNEGLDEDGRPARVFVHSGKILAEGIFLGQEQARKP